MPVRVLGYSESSATQYDCSSIDAAMQSKAIWIDVSDPTEAELRSLQRHFHIDELAVEDVLHRGQRPKIDDYGNFLFAVFHSPKPAATEIVIDEIFVFLGDKWMITVHYGECSTIDTIRRSLVNFTARFGKADVDFLFYALLDMVVDRYYPLLDIAGEKVESLENLIEEKEHATVRERFWEVRKDLLVLWHSMWPTHELASKILRGAFPEITKDTDRFFRDVFDHTTRLIELAHMYRDSAANIMNLQLQVVSARTNEVMTTLAIVATIFLPLSLVAGLFGTNFETIPGLGSEWGFFLMLGVMAAMAAGTIGLFKKRGWF